MSLVSFSSMEVTAPVSSVVSREAMCSTLAVSTVFLMLSGVYVTWTENVPSFIFFAFATSKEMELKESFMNSR